MKQYIDKAALAKARHYYLTGKGEPVDFIKMIFPEFAESEDEMIRKEVIKLVTFYYGSSLALKHTVSKDDMISWLEKQKVTASNENIEKMRNAAIQACQYMVDNFENSTKQYEDAIAWLRKQDKQKPVVIIPKFRIGDSIKTTNEEPLTITKIDGKGYWSEDLLICNFDDAAKWELVEQKPAWSEEDNKWIESLIQTFEDGYFEGFNQLKSYRVIDWLKSLKQRMGG